MYEIVVSHMNVQQFENIIERLIVNSYSCMVNIGIITPILPILLSY